MKNGEGAALCGDSQNGVIMGSTADRPTHLARILTMYREANFFSQNDVAKRLGVTRSAYAYYELGKAEPSNDNLRVLSKLYGAPIEDFFAPETTVSALKDSKYGGLSPELRPTNMGNLSDEERKLIALYRTTTPLHRRQIVKEIEKKIELEEELKYRNN